jgi:hypothetical protein
MVVGLQPRRQAAVSGFVLLQGALLAHVQAVNMLKAQSSSRNTRFHWLRQPNCMRAAAALGLISSEVQPVFAGDCGCAQLILTKF